MNSICLTSAVLVHFLICVEEPPLTGKQLTSMFEFNGEVELKCELETPISNKALLENGTPIWQFFYSDETLTSHTFRIAIYPEGKLFGDRRKEIEREIPKMQKKWEETIQSIKKQMSKEELESSKNFLNSPGIVHVKEKANGQKIFLFAAGGPGGMGLFAFTKLKDQPFDLMVTHGSDPSEPEPQLKEFKELKEFSDFSDAELPSNELAEMTKPGTPQKSILQVFEKIEKAVVAKLKKK